MKKCFAILILLSLFSIGCVKQYQQPTTLKSFVGTASWYGPGFHGKKTASGEKFNMYDLTAAHKTLPLGTIVKITNLNNEKAVIVKINDRGPFSGNRIIDVSKKAAQKLQMIQKGIIKVRIDVLKLGN
ncbi:MAG: septal ring lytic transglycosylase RlpA family protein [bacterium]